MIFMTSTAPLKIAELTVGRDQPYFGYLVNLFRPYIAYLPLVSGGRERGNIASYLPAVDKQIHTLSSILSLTRAPLPPPLPHILTPSLR